MICQLLVFFKFFRQKTQLKSLVLLCSTTYTTNFTDNRVPIYYLKQIVLTEVSRQGLVLLMYIKTQFQLSDRMDRHC